MTERDQVRQAGHTSWYHSDPDHDPRVTNLMRNPRASLEQINVMRRRVAEEYEQAADERATRADPGPMPVAMGVTADERGRPVQRSIVHRDVVEPGPVPPHPGPDPRIAYENREG